MVDKIATSVSGYLGRYPFRNDYFNCKPFRYFFAGLSDVRIKAKPAVEVGKALRMSCDYGLSDNRDYEESLYSIVWYFTPRQTHDSVDFRLWGNSGLRYRPQYPKSTVPFFRYRKIDPDSTRKVAWDSDLHGIFDVNVSQILVLFV